MSTNDLSHYKIDMNGDDRIRIWDSPDTSKRPVAQFANAETMASHFAAMHHELAALRARVAELEGVIESLTKMEIRAPRECHVITKEQP